MRGFWRIAGIERGMEKGFAPSSSFAERIGPREMVEAMTGVGRRAGEGR